MRLSEELSKKNRQKLQKKRNMASDEDEETMAYMSWPGSKFINEDSGKFAGFDEHSLNREKSVFDRTAIFHVTREEEKRV